MTGMPDPKAPMPTTPSAPSQQLRSGGSSVRHSQATNQIGAREQFDWLSLFSFFRRRYAGESSNLTLVSPDLFGGLFTLAIAKKRPYKKKLCRNDIITNLPRYGVETNMWYGIEATYGRSLQPLAAKITDPLA